MVGPLGVGVHTGTPAHGVQPFEDFQGGGVVVAFIIAVVEKGFGFDGLPPGDDLSIYRTLNIERPKLNLERWRLR
jgi:hypothetical protein